MGTVTVTVTATQTGTRTGTRTDRELATTTRTGTRTDTQTVTGTVTGTETTTRTGTITVTESATETRIQTATLTQTGTATQTTTAGDTVTVTGIQTVTATQTGTGPTTETRTETTTATRTGTVTRTTTASGTLTATETQTVTASQPITVTASSTVTQTETQTATLSQTSTYTQTATETQSQTATGNTTTRTATASNVLVTGTNVGTVTVKNDYVEGKSYVWTATLTRAETAPATFTRTGTATGTYAEGDATYTGSGTTTATMQLSGFTTSTTTQTVPANYSGVVSRTQVATGTGTGWNGSITWTYTKTATGSHTETGTQTRTRTLTATTTATATDTVTVTDTSTGTRTAAGTVTLTNSSTGTRTGTVSSTNTLTGTITGTVTRTVTDWTTVTGVASVVITSTRTMTSIGTLLATSSATGTLTDSSTLTRTSTVTITGIITVTGTSTSTATNNRTIILLFPDGVGPTDVVAAANGSLLVADRARAETSAGAPLALSNAGGGETDIGVESRLGSLTSVASVLLRERATVAGRLRTAGLLTRQNDTTIAVTPPEQNALLTPLSITAWEVAIPERKLGDVTLYSGSATVAPGRYARMLAQPGTTLTLSAGTYFVESFDIEPQATLKLDMTAGPIKLYATGDVVWRGNMVKLGGDDGAFMLVALGSGAVPVERPFTGTIVAPNAELLLGSTVPMTMQGWFYGRSLTVRTDTTLVGVPAPWGSVLGQDCGLGEKSGDYDKDGVPNCQDECSFDPAKTKPGMCGCNIPEDDDDGDQIPNCLDGCPNDPAKNSKGQCGCGGSSDVKPAGTPCTDSMGPQGTVTCDGNGMCGNNAVSVPGPDCRSIQLEGKTAWLCGQSASSTGIRSLEAASAACRAKGLSLLHIESPSENAFIQKLISAPIWLGANSISSAGTWRWATSSGNDGEVFWSGDAGGTRVGYSYVNWAAEAPRNDRCAVMDPAGGKWRDADCSLELGYVCEYRIPARIREDMRVPGLPQSARVITDCIDPLPDTPKVLPMPTDNSPDAMLAAQEKLALQYRLAVDAGMYTGAFFDPPTSSNCPFEQEKYALGVASGPNRQGCALTEIEPGSHGCQSDSECAPGHVCRLMPDPDPPPCEPDAGDCAPTFCGKLDCSALGGGDEPCDEVNLCNPGTEHDAGLDPDSKIEPIAFDPTALFLHGTPVETPSRDYVDEVPNWQANPDAGGTNHPWCRMGLQNPSAVAPIEQEDTKQQAKTKKSSPISVDFDPYLIFDVNPKPLAFGEVNLKIHAAAGMKASAQLNNFLGQSPPPISILEAAADFLVQRCTMSTAATKLELFGYQADLEAMGIPLFNTADPENRLYPFSSACNKAVAKYEELAGRAKKAFRDAQQLLKQFKEAKSLGRGLDRASFCAFLDTLDLDVPGFPGGPRCIPNESMAAAINRFIDYYQSPGTGQVAKLAQGAQRLKDATAGVRKNLALAFKKVEEALDKLHGEFSIKFLNVNKVKSWTLVSIPFAIGPIPCVLQVDLAAKYGITGDFRLGYNFPIEVFFGPGAPLDLAHAGANVRPYAGAALAVFVGAGVDYGAFAANIGIEGMLSLADLSAPVFAGVGLRVQVVDDKRLIPDDIANLVPQVGPLKQALQFGLPTAFKFSAYYDYGAGIDLVNVLSGAINARVRIKLAFFSRTWRLQILKFNGWTKHFDLITGGDSFNLDFSIGKNRPSPNAEGDSRDRTNVAQGDGLGMGLAEAEVPLVQLAYLNEDELQDSPDGGAPDPDAGIVAVSMDKLQEPFYDQLCCRKPGQPCVPDTYPACCGTSVCNSDTHTCVNTCIEDGQPCDEDGAACCGSSICLSVTRRCGACGVATPYIPPESVPGNCYFDSDCCPKRNVYCHRFHAEAPGWCVESP